MTFIKKSFSLHGHKPYNKVVTNQQIGEIDQYNDILAKAWQHVQSIDEQAQLNVNQTIEDANNQAQSILDLAYQKQEKILQQASEQAKTMLEEAEYNVQDILVNSEHRVTQEIWNKAQELIDALERTQQQFYTHSEEILKSILATIIKKLTSNIEVQDRMQILVSQVFEKAKDVEYATLFFNPQDYENLPTFHIPQTWKIEKDIMLDKGWCRLVGAGGEWKTSIALIERKMLESVEYKSQDTDSQTAKLSIQDEINSIDSDIDDENLDTES